MTSAEIRETKYNTNQEKLFIEVAAQVSELNENLCRLMDRFDAFLSVKAREDKEEKKAKVAPILIPEKKGV